MNPLFAFVILYCLFNNAFSTNIVYTHIPSNAGGNKGIAIQICLPDTARHFSCGAPVVIYIEGGFGGNNLEPGGNDFIKWGIIEIDFLFPGNTFDTLISGGEYDYRGYYSAQAIKDISLFAMGKITDVYGKYLDDYTLVYNIKTEYDNVGLFGSSNGGNLSITTAGVFRNELTDLAWIVNWESPVGDGMVTADAGGPSSMDSIYLNAYTNLGFDTSTNAFNYTYLQYCDTLIADMILKDSIRGNFYFDMNLNSKVDLGTDYVLSPSYYSSDKTGDGFMWAEGVIYTAYNNNLISYPYPAHIPSLAKCSEFWLYRNAAYWGDSAVAINSDLLFLVIASDTDHVQTSPTHPHIQTQYNLFQKNNTFSRINPDQSYIEYIYNKPIPAVDLPANFPINNTIMMASVEPETLHTNVPKHAAVCELADRILNNNYSPQLDSILPLCTQQSVIDETDNLDFELQVFPNPASNLITIKTSQKIEGVDLFDMMGQKQKVYLTQKDDNNSLLNVSYLNNGIYQTRLKIKDKTISVKFIITK